MTTLAGVVQTKLVSQMMIKTDQNELENFKWLHDDESEVSQLLVFGLRYC